MKTQTKKTNTMKMYNPLEDLSIFLTQIAKLNFTSETHNTLSTDDGWEVSLSIEFTDWGSDNIRLTIRLGKDNHYIESWGCATYEEMNMAGKWFAIRRTAVRNANHYKSAEEQKKAKEIFRNL